MLCSVVQGHASGGSPLRVVVSCFRFAVCCVLTLRETLYCVRRDDALPWRRALARCMCMRTGHQGNSQRGSSPVKGFGRLFCADCNVCQAQRSCQVMRPLAGRCRVSPSHVPRLPTLKCRCHPLYTAAPIYCTYRTASSHLLYRPSVGGPRNTRTGRFVPYRPPRAGYHVPATTCRLTSLAEASGVVGDSLGGDLP